MTSFDPTWRLCHPVTIYVYKNGTATEDPTLVHIPGDKKKNMDTALSAISERMKFTVGFAQKLYHIDGIRVCRTTELVMYGRYVVLTNLDHRFKCADYGARARSPLVVIGKESKHVRTIKARIEEGFEEPQFQRMYILKRHNNNVQLKYGFASNYEPDGLGPTDLPYVNGCNECGALCHRANPIGREDNACSGIPLITPKNNTACGENDFGEAFGCCDEYVEETDCEDMCPCGKIDKNTGEKYCCAKKPEMVDASIETDEQEPPTAARRSSVHSEHLLEFINKYRDIGSQLVNLFNERINEDLLSGTSSQKSLRPERERHIGDDLVQKFMERLDDNNDFDDYDDDDDGDYHHGAVSSAQSSKLQFNHTTFQFRLPDLDLNAMDDEKTGASGINDITNEFEERPSNVEEFKPQRTPSFTEYLQPVSFGEDSTGTTKPRVTSSAKPQNNITTYYMTQDDFQFPLNYEKTKETFIDDNENCSWNVNVPSSDAGLSISFKESSMDDKSRNICAQVKERPQINQINDSPRRFQPDIRAPMYPNESNTNSRTFNPGFRLPPLPNSSRNIGPGSPRFFPQSSVGLPFLNNINVPVQPNQNQFQRNFRNIQQSRSETIRGFSPANPNNEQITPVFDRNGNILYHILL